MGGLLEGASKSKAKAKKVRQQVKAEQAEVEDHAAAQIEKAFRQHAKKKEAEKADNKEVCLAGEGLLEGASKSKAKAKKVGKQVKAEQAEVEDHAAAQIEKAFRQHAKKKEAEKADNKEVCLAGEGLLEGAPKSKAKKAD